MNAVDRIDFPMIPVMQLPDYDNFSFLAALLIIHLVHSRGFFVFFVEGSDEAQR